jgi:3-methyl-2-oxobutanoate hydroxymethyltransferase
MADLPFLCRCGSDDETLAWSKRFLDDTGADGVKIEVTGRDVELVEKLADAGLPIIAHLGLLPQRLTEEGIYRAQGRDGVSGRRLIDEARAMEQAGAAALLLEAVSSEVARQITEQANIPVIGCVAGPHCDGTVVVLHDMIGHASGHPPRRVRQYEDLSNILSRAFSAYVEDIHKRRYPTEADSIHMKPGEHEKLLALSGDA